MSGVVVSPEVPGTRTIESLFSGFFVVPGYQRQFDWGQREVRDLLEDLHDHAVKNQHLDIEDVPAYLLNAILTVDRAAHLELIDGQQRITTLLLLFAAARHHALAVSPPLLPESWLQTLEVMVGVPDGDEFRSRLTDQDPDGPAQQFINGLAGDRKVAAADRLSPAFTLQRAYGQIREWLADRYPAGQASSGDGLRRLLQVTRKRVRVAEVRVASEAVAWQAFERANDRGKPLSVADLVKSDLFNRAASDADRATVAAEWQKLLAVLRAGDLSTPDVFLRHFALADLAVTKISKNAVRAEIKSYLAVTAAPAAAATLRDAAESYVNIRNGRFPDGSAACVPLADLRAVKRFSRFTQMLPVLLAGRPLDHATFTAVAEQVERLAVVVTLNEERGQDHEGDFFALARLVRDHCAAETIDSAALATDVRDRVDALLSGERAARFVGLLEEATRDRIGHDVTKYLLWRVEAQLRSLANPGTVRDAGAVFAGPAVDVEHVLAKSLPDASVAEFGDRDAADALVEALGNLTLWEGSPNSAVKDSPYSVKSLQYRASGFKMTKALAGGLATVGGDARVAAVVSSAPAWTREALERRHVELVGAVAALFVPGALFTLQCRVSGDEVVPSEVPTFPSCRHLVGALDGLNRGLRTTEDLVEVLDGVNTTGVPQQALAALAYLDLAQGEAGRWELTATGQLVCDESPDLWEYEIAQLIVNSPTLMQAAAATVDREHPAAYKLRSIRKTVEWAQAIALEADTSPAQPLRLL